VTSRDDELAALLALDALEADEQADAELRVGTFPPHLRATAAALAEATVTPAPADLREQTLRSALSRRRPGRSADGVIACSPGEAFRRTTADFAELLRSLRLDEWDVPAHEEHGRVRDLVAHLIGVDRLSIRWLRGDPDVPDLPDHVAATRSTVLEVGPSEPAELLRRWQDGVVAVAAAADTGPQDRTVTFHDLTLTIDGYLVTRAFELWAHAMDIALATGRPMPVLDDERMALMSGRLMGIVPLALAYRRTTAPGRTARFVLTGPAGGSYTVPLAPGDPVGEPDVLLVAPAVDVCRVAARRLHPRELDAKVEGDAALAELILAGIDAFARD
jgi:uncharacterized protein (TIGR03083 family)